jgi:hypothetical protein
VAIIVICLITYFVVDYMVYGYKTEFLTYKACEWIFTDSAKHDIDTFLVGGSIRKTDKIYTYIYKRHYYISIWEIYALRNVNLSEVKINQKVPLADIKLRGEILNADSWIQTHIRFGAFFKDKINIDLDEYSEIFRAFEKDNYRGFYGSVGKIAFENSEGKILALESCNSAVKPTVFFMYKANSSFYMITIHSEKSLDESIINIFNLQ